MDYILYEIREKIIKIKIQHIKKNKKIKKSEQGNIWVYYEFEQKNW